MTDEKDNQELHEVQPQKDGGEHLEELGQRVMPPPPLGDATKGQRVPPPPPVSVTPETPPAQSLPEIPSTPPPQPPPVASEESSQSDSS